MTNEQILEGNKLIAEFMGYKEGFPHEIDFVGIQTVEGYRIPEHDNNFRDDHDAHINDWAIEDLKYHTSWDWLMPVVVEKICLDLEYPFDISEIRSRIFCDLRNLEWTEEDQESILLNTYIAVLDFVKWFNEYGIK